MLSVSDWLNLRYSLTYFVEKNLLRSSTLTVMFKLFLLTYVIGIYRKATQSVGLLSYSFLRLTGQDDVIVPMVIYLFKSKTYELGKIDFLYPTFEQSNLNESTFQQSEKNPTFVNYYLLTSPCKL